MNALERAFVWMGGTVFVAALAATVWWYAVPLGRVTPFSGWRAVAINAALFSGFALHHSLFARASVKEMIRRLIPERLVRSVYVWMASVLLMLVCVLWRRVGGEAWRTAGAAALVNAGVQLAGFVLIVLAVRIIDPLELAGIRRAADGQTVQITGPYYLVRHPVYLGWILIVFGAAHLTGDRLAFAAISSVYLLLAIPWEERSLERELGDAYRRYKRQVRWRVIPYVY
jgi:protein-S-isoprenylcysteine O-methyltransferase Ste14